MEEIPISYDIPLPDYRKGIYPFAKMEVGGSFPVTGEQLNTVRALAHRNSKKLGRSYVVRPYEGAWRCWRTK